MPRRADAVHGRLAAHQAAAGREVQRASTDGPAVAVEHVHVEEPSGRSTFFERHAVPLDVLGSPGTRPRPPWAERIPALIGPFASLAQSGRRVAQGGGGVAQGGRRVAQGGGGVAQGSSLAVQRRTRSAEQPIEARRCLLLTGDVQREEDEAVPGGQRAGQARDERPRGRRAPRGVGAGANPKSRVAGASSPRQARRLSYGRTCRTTSMIDPSRYSISATTSSVELDRPRRAGERADLLVQLRGSP